MIEKEMGDLQSSNEVQPQPTIQIKHLPLLMRPKQTCELFGIDHKALHVLEKQGRVKAVRTGPKQIQRRYSPVGVARALGVDLCSENFTVIVGPNFTEELNAKLAATNEALARVTRKMIQEELEMFRRSIHQDTPRQSDDRPQEAPMQPTVSFDLREHRIKGYPQQAQQTGGYL